MKPEFDREIDALLRTRARSRNTPTRASVSHLDADELAAFAEGALPDAARARYVAHLADCDDCRRTATQLALASGVVNARAEREPVAAVATSEAVAAGKVKKGSDAEKSVALSWRERIAAFFAPSAWRYAMPVVALLCVGVIALVVLRRAPNAAPQLAHNNEEAHTNSVSESATSSVGSDQNHATPQDDQLAEVSTKSQPQGAATSAPAANERAAARGEENVAGAINGQAPSQTASNAVAGGAAGESSDAVATSNGPANAPPKRADDLPILQPTTTAAAPATRQEPEAQPRPSLAAQATPAPVPPPPASAETDRLESDKDEKAKQMETAEVREQSKARRARPQGREATAGAASPSFRVSPDLNASASASGGANGEDKESRQRGARDEKKSADDRTNDSARKTATAGETRAVAGRHFRREGDAWVDTAYHGGAATVVRRGSEQYRALVADEPEIARVADALGGEVVVVWKGRAYRIKP